MMSTQRSSHNLYLGSAQQSHSGPLLCDGLLWSYDNNHDDDDNDHDDGGVGNDASPSLMTMNLPPPRPPISCGAQAYRKRDGTTADVLC